MSKETVVTPVLEYADLRKRMRTLLFRITDIAKELETNDLTLVAHLLILDAVSTKKRKPFSGPEIHRRNGS